VKKGDDINESSILNSISCLYINPLVTFSHPEKVCGIFDAQDNFGPVADELKPILKELILKNPTHANPDFVVQAILAMYAASRGTNAINSLISVYQKSVC
jgi:hypothetical protein